MIVNKIKAFFKDEEGATAVEYGIMVAAIAAVIIAVVIALGTKVNNAFNKVDSAMTPNLTNWLTSIGPLFICQCSCSSGH